MSNDVLRTLNVSAEQKATGFVVCFFHDLILLPDADLCHKFTANLVERKQVSWHHHIYLTEFNVFIPITHMPGGTNFYICI